MEEIYREWQGVLDRTGCVSLEITVEEASEHLTFRA